MLVSRREILLRAAGGFGGLALASMLAEETIAAEDARTSSVRDPLAAKAPHFDPRAKRVIFIFLNGGLSHVDSFDHKPQLIADGGKSVRFSEWQGKKEEQEFFLKSPHYRFQPGGKSGLMVSDLFPNIRERADELCVINSLASDHTNHYEATLGMHTGSFSFVRPSLGAWTSYGLGTVNGNLPSFVVISPQMPYAGAQTWGSDFLPGCHQGTRVTTGKTPIQNLQRQSKSEDLQRLELQLIAQANAGGLRNRPEDVALEARIKSYETAFGMQTEAPQVFDLAQETAATLKLYGVDRNDTSSFGWQCLVARRFAERGVRFVELVHNNWDHHGDMSLHRNLANQVDQPIAGLLTDLRRRGMLDDTLVVLTTEFGRTPHHKEKDHKGREHHHNCFSSWLAGGGVKSGIHYGTSDEHGILPAENQVHLHDFHATILHLLGLNHERLTFQHAGRDYRLTDVHGTVVKDILA